MARTRYGYSGGEVVTQVDGLTGDLELDIATFDVYTARTSGTHETDLLDDAGVAISAVTPNPADGMIRFQGKDGYTADYWLQDQANPTNPRILVRPADLGNRVTALEPSAGFYVFPGGGIPESDLASAVQTKLDGAIQAPASPATGDLLYWNGSAWTRLAKGTIGQVLTMTGTSTLGWANPAAIALDALSDVRITSAQDGDMLQYVLADSLWENVDPTDRFAIVNGSGKLDVSMYDSLHPGIDVINSGDSPPSGDPTGTIILQRPATSSLVPLHLATAKNTSGSVTSSTGVTSSGTAQDVNVGDYVIFFVGTSGESGTPVTYTITASAGVIGTVTAGPSSVQSGTAECDILYAKCTTLIPAGSTFTIKPNATRIEVMVEIAQAPNLAASSPLDQQATGVWSAGASLALTVGPTSTTTLANELAVACFASNPGTAGTERTYSPGAGWSALGSTVVGSNGTAFRAITAVYQVLSATGTVTGKCTVGNTTDGTNAAGAAAVATFHG